MASANISLTGSTFNRYFRSMKLGTDILKKDLVFHDLDPQELRELAPKIPFELVEEFFFMGNASEIAARVSAYGDQGLEHVIVGNATGTVGGLDEITANAGEFLSLARALADL